MTMTSDVAKEIGKIKKWAKDNGVSGIIIKAGKLDKALQLSAKDSPKTAIIVNAMNSEKGTDDITLYELPTSWGPRVTILYFIDNDVKAEFDSFVKDQAQHAKTVPSKAKQAAKKTPA